MPNMFDSSLLWESRDLRRPAFTWAPTTAVLADQGLAWERPAVLLQALLGPV
jgi:hypothetical protein